MSVTPRIAVAVDGGYLLGRTRKLRFAIVIGGAITGRRYPTSVADLLRMGARYVNASPELDRLKDGVRDRLLIAGRDAAIAIAGYQLEALTLRMTARVARLEELDELRASPWATLKTTTASPIAVIDSVPAPSDEAGGETPGAHPRGEDWTVEPVMVAVLHDTAGHNPPGLETRPEAPTSVPERAIEGASA